MTFTELTIEEFVDFTNKSDQKNFFQTKKMVEKYNLDQIENYIVGVKENDCVIAATILTASNKNKLGFKIFNCYKGFILDYKNKNLTQFFTKELKKFIKNKDGFKLYIDPYIVSQTRNINGDVVEGINNLDVKDNLKSLGFKYIGKKYQLKWMFRMDINNRSSEDMFKSFSSTKRNIINKTINKFNLVVRSLDFNELDYFKMITEETSKRRGFVDKSIEYYQNMYNAFGEDVKFLVCELNCQSYLDNLNNSIRENIDKHTNMSDSGSKAKQKIQLVALIESEQKLVLEIEALKKEKGNIIPLACAMFILYGDEIVYLYSGSYDEYMKYKAQYRIQWEMIKYAADNNYKYYNFYGIHDFKNPNGNDYGVYLFKREFGGYVYETLGTFVYPINAIGKLHMLTDKINEY